MASKRRRQVKNIIETEEWIAVRFKADGVFFKCPSKALKIKKLKVGQCYNVQWSDGFKYKAELLKIGEKSDIENFVLGLENHTPSAEIKQSDSTVETEVDIHLVHKKMIDLVMEMTSEGPLINSNQEKVNTEQNSASTVPSTTLKSKLLEEKLHCDQNISSEKNLLNPSKGLYEEHNENLTKLLNPFALLQNEDNLEHETATTDIFDLLSESTTGGIMLKDENPDPGQDLTSHSPNKKLRRFPRLLKKPVKDDDDEVISTISDLSLGNFDESSDEEYYDSPGYVADTKNEDGDKSDEDINLPSTNQQPHSSKTSNNALFESPINVHRVKKSNNNIIKDKRVFCLYCENLVTNFPRHLERKHILEQEVKQFILLPKKHKERLKNLELLKNKGNLQYNKQVLAKNKGSLIVSRRPTSEDKAEIKDYLPCKYCFKFCKKKKLYRPMKICLFQNDHNKGHGKRRNNMMLSAMLLETENDHKQLHSEVFFNMKCDDVSFVAQNDDLICSFGSRLLQNQRDRHLKGYISQRLRQLSKFLIILRTLKPDTTNLKDFLTPKLYQTVVEDAKQLSGYDEVHNTYKHPSTALKIGHSIVQCSDILETQFIIEGKPKIKLQDIKNFVTVFQKEWKFSISSNACQDIGQKKFNKTIVLPDAKDITLLQTYLTNQLTEAINKIKKNEINQTIYKTITENHLCQIILLNRRRSGEVERIKLEDYFNRSTNVQQDIQKSLTVVEAKLTKNLVRFEIRGKRGRGVPVLLTPKIKDALDLLINVRKSADVLESNPYMFARPHTIEGSYRGTDCLRQAASKCGAAAPELLRSTKLRKNIATMSQLLCLTTNDREQLANFMGHDLDIHNKYYRLPDETLQISRVSKILLAMESGQLHQLRGKTIEKFDDFMVPINSLDSESENEIEDNCTNVEQNNQKITNKQLEKTDGAPTKKRGDYKKWSNNEINAIKRSLGKCIALKKIPQQHDCLLAIKHEPILEKRGWKKVKFQVANLIKKNILIGYDIFLL